LTIALVLKVHDGVVLASDSASTLTNQQGEVVNVYNNANKIFNLYKGLPIGSTTWGAGSIGRASICTLSKDLRRRLMGQDMAHADWKIDTNGYTMQEIAISARKFLYEEIYLPHVAQFTDSPKKPDMGYLITGYSAGRDLPEVWQIYIDRQGACPEPVLMQNEQFCGITWNGMRDAVSRILLGFGEALPQALLELGIPVEQISPTVEYIKTKTQACLIDPAMPIQDAIDLAAFLVEASIMFYRFVPGAPTVGGPMEVAAITKHEKFKWIARKHYFDPKYNNQEWRCPDGLQ